MLSFLGSVRFFSTFHINGKSIESAAFSHTGVVKGAKWLFCLKRDVFYSTFEVE